MGHLASRTFSLRGQSPPLRQPLNLHELGCSTVDLGRVVCGVVAGSLSAHERWARDLSCRDKKIDSPEIDLVSRACVLLVKIPSRVVTLSRSINVGSTKWILESPKDSILLTIDSVEEHE